MVDLIEEGEVLVLNNTEVVPAKLKGQKETGGKVEALIIEEVEKGIYEALLRPRRGLQAGKRIIFRSADREVEAEILRKSERGWWLKFEEEVSPYELGEPPLPPYIKAPLPDPSRYQTVYAKEKGSLAAPTAGLHFTPQLLQRLEEKGVKIVYITLTVGLGTFKPIRTERVEEHWMDEEYFRISEESARSINEAKRQGKRVIAVGTTVVRTLESAHRNGEVKAGEGYTSLFIYPGYEFKVIDALITNFHLPCSTPLLLVCAFAGKEQIFRAYEEAKKHGYRFLSLGDAMMII